MHCSTEVLSGDYSSASHSFRKIREVSHPDHLPAGILAADNETGLKQLNHWLIWRGIPGYRVGLDMLVSRLHIKDQYELLEYEHALSVSDTYWLKPEDSKLTYHKRNFFNCDFDGNGFATASFRKNIHYEPKDSARYTPNNTLCGYQRKAWIKKDGQLYLLKGGASWNQQECINEWLASEIAERLGMKHVPYSVKEFEHQLVSVCPCMTDQHTDLITAEMILSGIPNVPENAFKIEYYINALKEHGIENADDQFDEMLMMDCIMMNTDRHDQNFGVLADAETGRWKSLAPIFDNGTSLGCLTAERELDEIEKHRVCRLFNAKHLYADELGDGLCVNPYRFHLENLNGIDEEFQNVLVRYRDITGISNERIEKLVKLLQRRIERVKCI
ncbi:MAG: hypothetical protein EOM64_03765 [Erysipelotrichia bacterium]|nr:hypothetical protein [Erysipelotrichia bacterium]